MSEAGEFIDRALQREGAWYRADEMRRTYGGRSQDGHLQSRDLQDGDEQGVRLEFYGSSVGAVRGAVRDALRRHSDLTHDDVTALSSELWAEPVFERRLAAAVLLQSKVRLLRNSDLTRIEGFVRTGRLRALVDPLAVDVVGPLMESIDAQGRRRAEAVLDRWARESDVWLRRAALLAPLRALQQGGGDWDRFTSRAAFILAEPAAPGPDGVAAREAIALVLDEVSKSRPELRLSRAAQRRG
ncbi:DNA alkylation repair protein [Arthrobacter sp. NPDC093139]|uniref:DNA alkylation repair protein n=1 Tax=Arthrobacter sp. NPDC093139 TaxID=3363945 RepID=UPI00381DF039